VKEVRGIAAGLGIARSERTIRRWRKEGRIPHTAVETLVQRADQVTRHGGIEEAAQQLGRTVPTMTTWLTDPDHELTPQARQQISDRDRTERRSSAGIPVKKDGSLARLPKLVASGNVWVKGDTDSDTYFAHRNVDVLLDEETAEAILAASEAGDYFGARQAAEAFLSEYHAGCAGYSDEHGWHFDDLDEFKLQW